MRIIGLDFLRGIAILMVICRHSSSNNILHDIGWAGVDLFFVLSGFLVSGIVFKEYLANKKVDFKRFIIRRGFKIYPSFYFFIAFSICYDYFQEGIIYSIDKLFYEIFYLQSYWDGIWSHTWSLAVEEHFYLSLAFVMFIFIKAKLIQNKKFIPVFFIAMIALTFLMRFYVSYLNRASEFYSFKQSHLRMDGILIGVLISYGYHFTNFYEIFSRRKYLLLIVAAVLISPLFIFQGGSFVMNTIGLTTINLGFAILVLFSINNKEGRLIKNNQLIKFPLIAISFIGIHSYSIYLWHLFADSIVKLINPDESIAFVVILGTALSIGIILSYLIERPFLKMRDRSSKKHIVLSPLS